MSNERGNKTLQMSYSTAVGRLRKMLLFRQLKKYKDNVCVRCGLEIAVVEELSVEHIKPWEGRSAELFWDLDNVQFSHLRCNKPHIFRGGIGCRKIGPIGTAWCSRHRQYLPVGNFPKDSSRWNGLNGYCKECTNR
jgi:hypothetical protein